jgi:hypothetical protein
MSMIRCFYHKAETFLRTFISFQLRPSSCASCLPTFDLFNRPTYLLEVALHSQWSACFARTAPTTITGDAVHTLSRILHRLARSGHQRPTQDRYRLITAVISKLFPVHRQFIYVPLTQGMTSAPRGVLSV